MKMALVISFTMAVTLACAFGRELGFVQEDYRARAVQVKPTPEMLAGYAGAELCSGKRGDIRKIRWYLVPGPTFWVRGTDGRLYEVIGYTDGKDIYIASEWIGSIWLPRHESLHTFGYDGRHDPVVFRAKCKAHWPSPSDTL